MHSELVSEFFENLKACASNGPIIDLACGEGRNGLFLASKGLPVIFSDRSESVLHTVKTALKEVKSQSETWLVNFEQPNINPLENKQFSVALVFRYLHRPLLPYLLDAILPGGIVIYETFTTENKQFGRPNNPDFLFQPGELDTLFNNWETLHSFEGILTNPDRAVAQIVCRKPFSQSGKR